MKKLCNYLAAACLLVCGCVFAFETQARVCFATDENCGVGGNFPAKSDVDPNEEACKKEGYASNETTSCLDGYLKYNCPYKSSYIKCCAPDYIYSSCTYPLIPVGICGGKFKCKCDPDKYPYTEEKCHSDFKFSNPGGTACTQIDAVEATTTKTLYYSACLCERGLYPYSKQDCQETANADVNGDPCVDSQGNSYWDSCKCSNPPYKWESIDCEFGGKGKACVQGGVYFFKECCSCAAFPAEGERGSRPYDQHATKWNVCDCPRKGRFKITQCSEGWQPNANGSACERISCENAVKLYFKKHPGTSYGVFTGDKLVNYRALTPAEIERLPLDQQTYAVGAEVENSRAYYGVLAKDVNVKSCSKASKHIGCTGARNIYSGAYFGMLGSSADHMMVREACGAEDPEKTVIQTLNVSSSYFPNDIYDYNFIYIYGARLKFSGTTNVNRVLYLVNTNVSGSGATFLNTVNLSSNASYPNGMYPFFDMTSSTFKNTLNATGYDFNLGYYGRMDISVPSSYKNNQIARITLYEGQEFRGGSLYVYPETDSFVTRDNAFPSATNWGSYVSFVGPSSSNPADVYTNAYIGYKSSKSNRARQMLIKMSGNLRWNMYDGSTRYTLGLTSGSSIVSTDYGTGNYAKMVFGNTVNKKTCYMRGTIGYIVNRKSGWSCATKRCDEDGAYYAACTVNYAQTLNSVSATGDMSCRGDDCKCRKTYFQSDCSIGYTYHDSKKGCSDYRGKILFCE